MNNKFPRATMDTRERSILMSGDYASVSQFVWNRFSVRILPGDSFKCCVLYPINWTGNRLRYLGYFETADPEELVYPLRIGGTKVTVARSKLFKCNIRATPIDLVAWLVTSSQVER